MSNIQQNDEGSLNFRVFKELVEFEKELATARKRTRDADFLDRKLVISDSTEFERHFESLSETIARLLPYHTFYTDEIRLNLIDEGEEKIQERKKRIKKIQDSIMEISLNNSSLVFNASKYGIIRLLYSSFAMELERNKKELSQQALELSWKYPINVINNNNNSNNNGCINYINNKQYINNNNVALNNCKPKQFGHINDHNYTTGNNTHQISNYAPKYHVDSFSQSYSSLKDNLKTECEINNNYNYPHIPNNTLTNYQKQTVQSSLSMNNSIHVQQNQHKQLSHISNPSLLPQSLDNELPKT
ncbi:hypothetical protein FG386_003118 [Cryptosporidium ryanae]|uniref:uncharacterized protein n=1 Tax=Cryptosporidium ryanae TaxID=515981 RepID=UPI00351A056B|nr:hypothetical protein FG386_003118 [Cryptosporidium ryanae]